MRNHWTVDHMPDWVAINLLGKELADGDDFPFVKTSSSIGWPQQKLTNACWLYIGYMEFTLMNMDILWLFVNCHTSFTSVKFTINVCMVYIYTCILYICIYIYVCKYIHTYTHFNSQWIELCYLEINFSKLWFPNLKKKPKKTTSHLPSRVKKDTLSHKVEP